MEKRKQLQELAKTLLNELNNDDWENSTVRELIAEMQACNDYDS